MLTSLKQLSYQQNLIVTEEQLDKLNHYVDLLIKWNKTYNLVATDNRNEIEIKHILDSLAVSSYVTENHILDVGTGAGFPGIPLAVINPDKKFTLLDSNGKKTRFLTQVIYELKLDNVVVENSRIENFHTKNKFEAIICRALTSIPEFIQQTEHLIKKQGRWYAMKGKIPEQELAELKEGFTITPHILQIPGLDAERHLIVLKGR